MMKRKQIFSTACLMLYFSSPYYDFFVRHRRKIKGRHVSTYRDEIELVNDEEVDTREQQI